MITNDSLFDVRSYRVSFLRPEDGPDLQALFERDPRYFQLVFGHPPGTAEAQSTYTALPEGKGYEDKLLLGVFGSDQGLIGIADLIRDYPTPGTWTVGLLFLDPSVRGDGLGQELYSALERWAAAQGAQELRLGVVEQNEGARRFFERVGFDVVGEEPDAKTGIRASDILVMVKRL